MREQPTALVNVVVADVLSRTINWPQLVGELKTKATYLPSYEIDGAYDPPGSWTPFVLTLTSSVVPASRSRTKTSDPALKSFGTRFVAALRYAISRPSAEMHADHDSPFASVPSDATLTRSVRFSTTS